MKKQMLFDTADTSEETSPTLRPGKDEMNFAEFPIALLTDRVPKGQKVIKFEDDVYDEKRKRMVLQRRVIEGSEEYGLPTATDDLVILALIQLSKLRGDFSSREVEFTRLELIKLLGWADEGRSYDRIKLSLLRIKGVNYVYDNAWWDVRQKMWTTRAFNIIDNVEINDSRTSYGQSGLFTSRIMWNEVVFDSFQSGFLRDIDFQLCVQLKHPTALRMYRFLGKQFYRRPDWEFDLKLFAQKHMALGGNYEGGTQLARKLAPAIAELEQVGFLEPLSDKERFIKNGRKWTICLVQKAAPAPLALPNSTQEEEPDQPRLVAELISRGVTAKTAADLVKQHPTDIIQAKIEEFDWEMSQPKPPQKPAGYLVKSIRDGYAADPKFVSAAERQQQEAAKVAKARKEADARLQKQQEEARQQAQKQLIDGQWKALAAAELARLDAVALAEADEGIRQTYETMKSISDGSGYLLMIRREYLRKRLQAEGKLPPDAK
jgi:hypothetical protein